MSHFAESETPTTCGLVDASTVTKDEGVSADKAGESDTKHSLQGNRTLVLEDLLQTVAKKGVHSPRKEVVTEQKSTVGYDNGHIPRDSDICASLDQVLTVNNPCSCKMMRPITTISPSSGTSSADWSASERDGRSFVDQSPDFHCRQKKAKDNPHHDRLQEKHSVHCAGGAVMSELHEAFNGPVVPPVMSKVKATRLATNADEPCRNINNMQRDGQRKQHNHSQHQHHHQRHEDKQLQHPKQKQHRHGNQYKDGGKSAGGRNGFNNRCPSESPESLTDSDFSLAESELSTRKPVPVKSKAKSSDTMALMEKLGTTHAGCLLHIVAVVLSIIALLVAALTASNTNTRNDAMVDGEIGALQSAVKGGVPLSQRLATIENQLQVQRQQPSLVNPELQRRIQNLEMKLAGQQGQQDPSNSQSAIYTRWGRRSCSTMIMPPMVGLGQLPGRPMPQPPNPRAGGNGGNMATQMIYEGVVGGSLSGQSGGGANALCLPLRPTWGNYSDMLEGGGRLFGAEYRLGHAEGSYNVFENTLQPGRLNMQKVPCALCQVRRASSVLMIPASLSCPIGWNRQYHGYLMSERAENQRAEFICVDHQAEASPHYRQMHGVQSEAMTLFPVEASCGSLPCAPYVSQREVACVVCTR